ncbi:MAG: EamA family transporter [Candidatus Chisholmbacteria bacterium]|nr:EamA family transporter [Candidatus Chisholmbacteria bacterium]
MSWPVLAVIGVVSLSVGNLFQRLTMKDKERDPIVSVFIFQFLMTCFALTFALVKGFHLPPQNILLPGFLSSTIYAFGGILLFKAIKIIEASEAALLSTFGAVVSIIVAYFFLDERLRPSQLLGVGLIIASVVAIRFEKQSLKFNHGSLMTLIGTSMFGLAVVIDAHVIRSFDAASYLVLTTLTPTLILGVVFPKKIFLLTRALRYHLNAKLIIFSLLYGIQAITFYLALELGALASQMNTIIKTQTVLTVILAAIFLKETSHLGRKALSALLVTLGIFLIR